MKTVVDDECTCDEYRARLRMCRIQVGRRLNANYLFGHHPEVGTLIIRDPEALSPAERADAIAHYEEQYGETIGDC